MTPRQPHDSHTDDGSQYPDSALHDLHDPGFLYNPFWLSRSQASESKTAKTDSLIADSMTNYHIAVA